MGLTSSQERRGTRFQVDEVVLTRHLDREPTRRVAPPDLQAETCCARQPELWLPPVRPLRSHPRMRNAGPRTVHDLSEHQVRRPQLELVDVEGTLDIARPPRSPRHDLAVGPRPDRERVATIGFHELTLQRPRGRIQAGHQDGRRVFERSAQRPHHDATRHRRRNLGDLDVEGLFRGGLAVAACPRTLPRGKRDAVLEAARVLHDDVGDQPGHATDGHEPLQVRHGA